MTFELLVRKLEIRLKETLPAALAHEVMRAVPTNVQTLEFNHKLPPKPGSVMIFIYPEPDGSIHFPLIKRPEYTGAHSGQVSFPGGKAEAGETPIQTALREAHEEVGLKPEDVTVLGVLTNFFVIPSNFMVTPVVGYASKKPEFIADKIEVVRILDGTIDDLLPDESIKISEILIAKTYQMKAPHFLIDNEMVWGATAMMLNEFRVLLKEIISSSSQPS